MLSLQNQSSRDWATFTFGAWPLLTSWGRSGLCPAHRRRLWLNLKPTRSIYLQHHRSGWSCHLFRTFAGTSHSQEYHVQIDLSSSLRSSSSSTAASFQCLPKVSRRLGLRSLSLNEVQRSSRRLTVSFSLGILRLAQDFLCCRKSKILFRPEDREHRVTTTWIEALDWTF